MKPRPCSPLALATAVALSLAGITNGESHDRKTPTATKELQQARAKVDTLQRHLNDLKRKDAATLAELAAGLAESENRASKLEQAQKKLRREAETIAERAEKLAQQQQRADAELAKRSRHVEELARQNKLLEAHLAKVREEAGKRIAEQRDLAKRELLEQRRAAQAAEILLAEHRAAAERELQKHLAAAQRTNEAARSLREELELIQAETKRVIAGHQKTAEREIAKHATAVDEARAIAKDLHEKLAATQAKTEQALAGHQNTAERELAKHLTAAEKAQATAEDLRAKLSDHQKASKREIATHLTAAEEARAVAKDLQAKLEASQAQSEQALAEQLTASKREIAKHATAAEAAKQARKAAEEKLAEALKVPRADPKNLAKLALEKTAADQQLVRARTQIDQLQNQIAELTATTTRARADLVAEQVVRTRLQSRLDEAETKLAAATSKHAPPVIVQPARPAAPPAVEPVTPSALAVLRFDKNAGETARDREKLLSAIQAVLAGQPGAEFDVVGHTCCTGNSEANQNLSVRRADSVRDFLVRGGVSAEKLHTRGAGETAPVADNRTLEGRRLNRRVEVLVRD